MADQINSQSAVDEAIRPSVSPTCNNKPTNQSINQLINQSINQSINHSFWARSFFRSVVCSSCSFPPSFLPSFNWEPRCPCFAGAVEFLLSVRVQLLLQRKEHQSVNQSIIRSSSGLVRSFSWYFIRLPSFLYLFIQLVPICPCFAGAVEFLLSVRVQLLLQQKEHTINHSLPWVRSVLQSVSRSSSFLPSYLPSFMHSLN